MKQIYLNRWQPPPSFHIDTENFLVEKVNQDIPINVLQLTYTPGPTLNKPNYVCKIKLLTSEGQIIHEKEFEAYKPIIFQFPLDKASSFTHFESAEITIEIICKKGILLFSSKKVKLKEEKLSLSHLEKNIDFEKQYTFGENPTYVVIVFFTIVKMSNSSFKNSNS